MTRLWIEDELERRLAVAAEVEGRVWLEQDEAAEVLDALAAAREASSVPASRHSEGDLFDRLAAAAVSAAVTGCVVAVIWAWVLL